MKRGIQEQNKEFTIKYLWVILSYFALLLLGIVLTIIELKIFYIGEEEIAISFGAAFVGLIVIIFNVYNVIALIKMLKCRVSKRLAYLSLSEILLLIFVMFSVFVNLSSQNLIWLIAIVKVAQLTFVIYLLKKAKYNVKV